ncbi:MAG: beta-galactosidase [Candidatus Cloacimonetes bacterium]|nr:beta-galactosidase [Candidatus Cloacimonadota bacterium]
MSIIGKVGRRSNKVRVLNLSIHLVLIIGAITMVYPFLLMISASLRSNVDGGRLSLIPKYLHNDEALFQKYLESRYNEESSRLADNYAGGWLSFAEARLPEKLYPTLIKDWQEFLAARSQGVYDYYVAEHYGRGVYPLNQRRYRKLLRQENDNDLSVFNRRYNTGAQSWEQIVVEEKEILGRNYVSVSDGYLGRFQAFKKALGEHHRNYVNLDGAFVQMELAPAYGGDLATFNAATGLQLNSWRDVVLSESCPPEGDPLRPAWLHYVREALNIHHISLPASADPAFQAMLKEKYADISLLNSTWHTNYADFSEVRIPQQIPDSGAMVEDLTWFVENAAAPEDLQVSNIGNEFRDWLREKHRTISALNASWELGYDHWEELSLPASTPADNIARQSDWLEFARGPGQAWLELLPSAQSEWLALLTERFPGQNGKLDLSKVNQYLGSNYNSEEDVYPSPRLPREPRSAVLWRDFVEQRSKPNQMKFSADKEAVQAWQDFLRVKYTATDSMNQAWQLVPASFEGIPLPVQQIEAQTFWQHKGQIRREFLTRNYAMVLDQMFNDARSLRNTAIYTLLSILLAVTVNPLAAYALSRFKPRLSYQIILLFMLTMAFPAMVMGIPNFLMLKRLNLLNTFWALVLPAAADGYFIFLLKGFFDSLPRELYESASLDGAGEIRLFWQFTLYLSKPILAVIALGAFNAAYRNFLFAFIVCQDQSMWTLMVHIYELMQRASLSVGYAALVIAAIPTLAVFVFFQNIIIRGIVIPMEK